MMFLLDAVNAWVSFLKIVKFLFKYNKRSEAVQLKKQ